MIIREVSEIKRKLIIALTAAFAVLLSGCSGDDVGSVYSLPAQSSSSTTVSSSSPQSGYPADESSTEDSGSVESTTSSEPAPITPPDFSIAEETGTFYYSKDPKNPVTVTFADDRITVRMKGEDFTRFYQSSPAMNVAQSTEDGFSVYTLTPAENLGSGLGSLVIVDKNNWLGDVYFSMSDGKIKPPDLRPLAEHNQSVYDSVTNSSEDRIAQAITINGARDKIPEIWSEIEKISNEICEGIDDDYEKLRAIADWVSSNIYYDRPATLRGEPPSCLTLEYMLNNRSSVCGGYANMTAALCQVQDIRCISIVGKALIDGNNYLNTPLEGGLHEWNVVEIDGRQIIVDSCWMSTNNLDYTNMYIKNENTWKWFDCGAEIFATDHRAETAEYKDFRSLV